MRNSTILRPAAIAVALLAITAFATPVSAFAAGATVGLENTQKTSSLSYWTPEMIRSARPLPVPKITFNANAADEAEADAAVEANGTPTGADGAPPRGKVPAGLATRLMSDEDADLAEAMVALEEYDAIEGDNFGTLNGQFSSTRVFPDAATTTYPYRTVGKLFFTIPGQGNFICSGSVLRKRVILTAGHCVHSGTSAGFYSNFMFVPAYRNGVAPFGTWDWQYVATTPTWVSGGANFPNAADYAMIEPRDRGTSIIGNVTGFLGYQTLKLFPNHAHLLGYPANHDSGNRMHEVTAQSLRKATPNAVEYGSDMRGGSSGGPWVQNFGVVSSGQTGGSNTGSNRVIGITSYGFVSTTPLIQGSSVPDSRFTALLTKVCNHRAGNC